MTLITVYAKREPTTDSVLKMYGGKSNGVYDVVVYKDKQCSNVFARIPWHYTSKPTRRNKYITLNCYKWRLEWVR